MYHGRCRDGHAVARSVLAGALFFLSATIARDGVLFIFHVRAISSDRDIHGGCASTRIAAAYGGRRRVRNPRLGVSFCQAWFVGTRYSDRERRASFGMAWNDRGSDLAGLARTK